MSRLHQRWFPQLPLWQEPYQCVENLLYERDGCHHLQELHLSAALCGCSRYRWVWGCAVNVSCSESNKIAETKFHLSISIYEVRGNPGWLDLFLYLVGVFLFVCFISMNMSKISRYEVVLLKGCTDLWGGGDEWVQQCRCNYSEIISVPMWLHWYIILYFSEWE